LASLVHRCAGSPDCVGGGGGVSVYMSEWPLWPVYSPIEAHV
jgi:hypothetical protein